MTKKILRTNADFVQLISKLPTDGEIYCSTFNVSTWEAHGAVTNILNHLNMRKAHLIVGVPFFRSCTGDYGRGRCKSCLDKQHKTFKNLAKLRDAYTNIDWKFVNKLHAKFMVAANLIVTGGRNISDGEMADLSFAEDDPALADELRQIWHEYSASAYDIGATGPLVFISPYKGEIMADSKSILPEYKEEVLKSYPNSIEANFWKKSTL